MNLKKEASEDLGFIYETVLGDARREYYFDGPNGPIIGIHGAVGSGWTKDGLRTFMEKNGVGGGLLLMDFLTKGIDHYLPRLDAEIKKWDKPTILALSAGGFVALRWAQLNGWENINKIITVATPFNGSPRLFGFIGPTIKETRAGTPKLQEILDLTPPEGKVLSIFAEEDKFVPKPKSIKLNWQKVITGAKSHGDIQNHIKWYEKKLEEAINLKK